MKFSEFRDKNHDKTHSVLRPEEKGLDFISATDIAAYFPGMLIEPGFPVIVRNVKNKRDFHRILSEAKNIISKMLYTTGSILFRDFPVTTASGFYDFVSLISGSPMGYVENTSPRTDVYKNIKTSTDYHHDETILLHNEHSFTKSFPAKLFLYCMKPARSGGYTPIADCRKVLKRLPDDLITEFLERRWMYVRNFDHRMRPSVNDIFGTDDKSTIEEYCRKNNIDYHWYNRGKLTARYLCDPLIKHPATKELSWFNHITFWHISNLSDRMKNFVVNNYSKSVFPNNAYYGDGGEINSDVIKEINLAYERERRQFCWKQGDILMVDNILCAHGRSSFSPPREILFCMTDTLTRDNFGVKDSEE